MAAEQHMRRSRKQFHHPLPLSGPAPAKSRKVGTAQALPPQWPHTRFRRPHPPAATGAAAQPPAQSRKVTSAQAVPPALLQPARWRRAFIPESDRFSMLRGGRLISGVRPPPFPGRGVWRGRMPRSGVAESAALIIQTLRRNCWQLPPSPHLVPRGKSWRFGIDEINRDVTRFPCDTPPGRPDEADATFLVADEESACLLRSDYDEATFSRPDESAACPERPDGADEPPPRPPECADES